MRYDHSSSSSPIREAKKKGVRQYAREGLSTFSYIYLLSVEPIREVNEKEIVKVFEEGAILRSLSAYSSILEIWVQIHSKSIMHN